MSRLAHALVCVGVLLLAGCTPAARHAARPHRAPPPRAIVDALAAREAAMPGLRLSMTVKTTGTGRDSLLASPAYLAIDDTGGIRLQVLSPFGVTVLDLAIRNEVYTLTMPLTHESRDGTVDLRTLSDPAIPIGDRMIVALALMFRPKAHPETCRGAGSSAVTCAVGSGVTATVTVDERLRPEREVYRDAAGTPLLGATFGGYRGEDARAQPGSLLIEDTASGARMAIQVTRVRTAAAPS